MHVVRVLTGIQRWERLFPVAFKKDFIDDWIDFRYAEIDRNEEH